MRLHRWMKRGGLCLALALAACGGGGIEEEARRTTEREEAAAQVTQARPEPETAATANVEVDPALARYERASGASGNFSSVGSDTLNNLMSLCA
ncbi:MAG TPA: hypothetical protein VHN15_14355, partial [Thermoanaerobaculia bacterium]|nr:hypothetical protein [Thermoanaerobaculia bacterium]